MGKCMSKNQMNDTLIQHISSPVRTDDGVGFALGRLSSSHQTRWLKYEDMIPSEEEKPVVSEGQAIMSRSGSRSYGLTFPQGHLVSCAAFVSGGPHGDSKECTCGHRRPADVARAQLSTNSPGQKHSLAIIQKLSPVVIEPKKYRNAPENDIENIGAKPLKLTYSTPTKTRPALRETNVNVNVPVEVHGGKSRKVLKESRENVDVEDMLPRRASPRKQLRPSLTEREFQALDSPPSQKTPTKRSPPTVERKDEVFKSPVKAENCSSPKNASNSSLGSSLQSILSAISDPESSSLVEEVLSKASAAQSRCTDLEKAEWAESNASHTPLSDESDTDSSLGEIVADTPSSKAVSRHSIDQFEDGGPGNTPLTARSVRTRLPVNGEFYKEEKPLHWKASALYTNCLFEESPAKDPVKSADRKSPVGVTKFTFAHEAEADLEHRSEKPLSSTCNESTREVLQSDNAELGLELKRKSLDETLSLGASTTPFKKVKSLTEKTLSSELQLPAPGSSYADGHDSDTVKEVVTPAEGTVNPDSEVAPEVMAFLHTSKKVVLSLGPDNKSDCEAGAQTVPSLSDSLTSNGFKEIFSSNSLAAVLELEALLVTSDVRRMSGHGVEGLQIVGSELTELFSSNMRPSIVEDSKGGRVHSARHEVTLGDLSTSPHHSLPKSVPSPTLSSQSSLASCKTSATEDFKVAPTEAGEESNDRATLLSQDPCLSETFELTSLDHESPISGKMTPQAAEGVMKPVRRKGEITPGYTDIKSPVPLSFSVTTSEKRTAVSCSPQSFVDHSSYSEASALSVEDFQLLLDAAEREEEKNLVGEGSPCSTRRGNTLACFGRSILQKLRDSLPTTPNSSLPSTPRISASSTPHISRTSTPQRTGPHGNSVALTPEEIAEIWGAFEQTHLN